MDEIKNECMNMEETNKVLNRIQSDLETLIEIKKHRR
jgi:hypothetical protein